MNLDIPVVSQSELAEMEKQAKSEGKEVSVWSDVAMSYRYLRISDGDMHWLFAAELHE